MPVTKHFSFQSECLTKALKSPQASMTWSLLCFPACIIMHVFRLSQPELDLKAAFLWVNNPALCLAEKWFISSAGMFMSKLQSQAESSSCYEWMGLCQDG